MAVPGRPDSAYERLYAAITAVTGHSPRSNGSQASARCPAHDDRTASLSITRGPDRVLVKCHAGCAVDDVLARVNLTRGDLFDNPPESTRPVVVAEYPYTDETGTVLFVKERREPKDFRVKRPNGSGGWTYSLGDARRVLYRLPQILEAIKDDRPIHVAEGEKDVAAIERMGGVATTNFEGAAKDGQRPKWRPEYGDALKGAAVIIVADRDEPGRAHARAILADLKDKAASVRVVEAKVGKDAHDHAVAGHGLADFVEASERPQLTVVSADDGLIKYVNWRDLFGKPKVPPDWYARPFIAAGRVTLIYSPGKTGKSLLAMEAAAGIATGMPLFGNDPRDALDVLYIDQEMTEEDWLERLTDMGYGTDDVDSLEKHLHLAQLQPWAPMDTVAGGAMVLAAAEESGARVVIIDTASKVMAGDENSNDTQANLYRCTIVPLKRAGLAVLILDHTGKDIEKGARGASAKTDNVDLVWEMTARGKDGISLRCTHARFRHESLEEYMYLRRETEPHLAHVPVDVDKRADEIVGVCLEAIRCIAPNAAESGASVLAELKKMGRSYRKETFLDAWKAYRREMGWEF